MRLDEYGLPIYNDKDILELLYKGFKDINSVLVEDSPDIRKFNANAETKLNIYSPLNIDRNDFDLLMQSEWFMPDEYKNMDIEGFLVDRCPKENYQRLIEELEEFRSRNMLDLLRWLKYFVDTCRKNDIVWGVGRGSSVSSYVLFLIGVHKIDSLKYKLDWRDFLR